MMHDAEFRLLDRVNIRGINRMFREKDIPLRARLAPLGWSEVQGARSWLFEDIRTGEDVIHWFTNAPLRAWFRSGVWQYNQM